MPRSLRQLREVAKGHLQAVPHEPATADQGAAGNTLVMHGANTNGG